VKIIRLIFLKKNPLTPSMSPLGLGLNPTGLNQKKNAADTKRKAGFYLSVDILNRFNRKFHELKLEGVAIENKSALLELALSFALDDMDKSKESRLLSDLIR
jgi:hypothetical protein